MPKRKFAAGMREHCIKDRAALQSCIHLEQLLDDMESYARIHISPLQIEQHPSLVQPGPIATT